MLLTKSKPSQPAIDLLADRSFAEVAGRLADAQTRGVELQRARTLALDGPTGADIRNPRAESQALAQIESQIAANASAVATLARTLEEHRGRVSIQICQEQRPRHRAIVRRIADALTELSDVLEEEIAFRDELNHAGVMHSGALRAMPLPALGTLRDPHSAASRWLADAVEHGLVSEVRR